MGTSHGTKMERVWHVSLVTHALRRNAVHHTSERCLMAVSVLLDLTQVVSVPDLRHFLSYLPDGFDPAEDLRMSTLTDERPYFLEISLPVPGAQE